MPRINTVYCGLKLSSPIIVGSSGLGETVERMEKAEIAGAGAVVMKSLFEEVVSRRSPTPRFKVIEHDLKDRGAFTFFSYEQASEWGPERYAREVSRAKKSLKIKIIPSINCLIEKSWRRYARMMEDAGADAIELNLSCPHGSITFRGGEVEETIVRAAAASREAVKIPVIGKISPMLTAPDALARELERIGLDGVVIFNRMTALEIDVGRERPALHGGYAGHGGPWAIQYSLRWISQIRPQLKIDIAGSGGVTGADDLVKYILAGADAVQVCTAIYLRGYSVITGMNAGLAAWMAGKKYKSLDDFRGKVCGRILGTKQIDRRRTRIARIDPRPSGGCQVACPVSVPIQAFLSLLAAGDFTGAFRTLKSRDPFQETLARICPAPCEENCTRQGIEEAVSIRRLKRFVFAWAEKHPVKFTPSRFPGKRKRKAAVVGAGPAGLACAYDLARAGYRVEVFEAENRAGGMLHRVLPAFRLPPALVRREVENVRKLGVKIKLSSPAKDVTGLLRKGYSAVCIAIGASRPKSPEFKTGGESGAVMEALDFLRRINQGEKIKFRGRAAVIGGGNVAFDAARSALRLGAKEIFILYRRTRAEMPAYPEEILAAEEEGIKIMYQTIPVRIVTAAGRVTGIECVKLVLGKPDASGRRRPETVAGTEFFLAAETVISALGQEVDNSALAGIKLTGAGLIRVNPKTGAAIRKGIFAAGDAIEIAGVAEAVAGGRRAAAAMDRYLSGRKAWLAPPEKLLAVPRREVIARHPEIKEEKRVEAKTIALTRRRTTFAEVEQGLTEAEARKEARRCLVCGCGEGCALCRDVCIYFAVDSVDDKFVIDPEKCSGCGLCVELCPNRTIEMIKR